VLATAGTLLLGILPAAALAVAGLADGLLR